MKKTKIILLLALLTVCVYACKNDDDINGNGNGNGNEDMYMPEENETQHCSFQIESLNIQYDEEYYLCQEPHNINIESGSGEEAGFYLKKGVNFPIETQDKVEELFTNIFVRGMQALDSNIIPLELVLDICQNQPENRFAYVVLKVEGVYYSSTDYDIQPFTFALKDENATSSFVFLNDEIEEIDCDGGIPFLPIQYTFDGYVYNQEKTDSLYIRNLKSQFIILEL